MDARYLDPAYRVQTQPFEVPTASPPPLNDPTAFQVQPGPVGAQALGQQPPELPATPPPVQPGAASPAAAMAGAATEAPAPASKWTPERKAFANRVNQTARNYRKAVEQRRTIRKERSAYGKLKSQLETSAGTLSDLKSMEDTYKDIYTPDSPATLAIQRQQASHFEKVQRLREQLAQKAQALNKQYGFKLNKQGGLADEDGLDEGDQEFDEMMREGYMDGALAQPPQ